MVAFTEETLRLCSTGKCRAGVRGGQNALCDLFSDADKRGVCDKP